jgi:hypothetical protein
MNVILIFIYIFRKLHGTSKKWYCYMEHLNGSAAQDQVGRQEREERKVEDPLV